ncbi:MAG TPA: nucleotide sugar dehydrogenase [Candidatus Limnocylindrales bacterium]|nr:nucleotide sugar dehydrogenase [Candidatus Limnocylindrales bacterium]
MSMNLEEKIASGNARAGVVGLGYVGLPLAVELAHSGLRVMGIDVSESKVAAIKAGRSYILDVPTERVAELVRSGHLDATTDFASVAELDTINVCVPTPLRKTREPDLSYVIDAVDSLVQYMRPGQLLILESTTYPGTTEEIVLPRLRDAGLEPGKDVEVAFSPERTDPGNRDYNTRTIPKVVGGHTPAANRAACALYGRCIDKVVSVSSPRVAEMVKLLENTFRSVNIALVNEMAMMCDRLGIDVWEVIDAAATKPFGFMPFYPGPGLGGHCIPVDPHYLTWKARAEGFEPRFIELAGQINSQKPEFVASKVMDALNDRGRSLKGSKILALGVAYKRDVDDVRESPSLDVMALLLDKGADITFCDPFVSQVELRGKTVQGVALDQQRLASADLVLLLTDHSSFDRPFIAKHAPLIVDTRNAFKGITGDNILRV